MLYGDRLVLKTILKARMRRAVLVRSTAARSGPTRCTICGRAPRASWVCSTAADFDTWSHYSNRSGAVAGLWPAECWPYTFGDVGDNLNAPRHAHLTSAYEGRAAVGTAAIQDCADVSLAEDTMITPHFGASGRAASHRHTPGERVHGVAAPAPRGGQNRRKQPENRQVGS